MQPSFEMARALCQAAVRDGVVPGLVVLAATGGKTVFHQAFGQRQLTPRQLPALPDTVYDVASLTKAVATSIVAMQQVDRGLLTLDTPVRRQIPEFLAGDDRDGITVRHLLCHASGLPAHRPYFQSLPTAPSQRWAIELAAAHEPLVYRPGEKSVYSDLGFILLGWLLEHAAGQRLDVQVDRGIVGPANLTSTTFVNLADSEARARLLEKHTVAATQHCPQRQRVVLGEVDDLNAYAMGGIAGHAGLFSSATDLGAIAAALCAAWKGAAGAPLVNRDVIRTFWTPAGIPGSTWRLGWDGPAATNSQAGARLSRQAVGHLAFTGCSLWIDPEREQWIVLLSNRVHPQVPAAGDDRFRRFRPALHDALGEALA